MDSRETVPLPTSLWGLIAKFHCMGILKQTVPGGFNDVTFADDLKADKYKLYFADDANSDGTFDIGAKRVYANVSIPCEGNQNNQTGNMSAN